MQIKELLDNAEKHPTIVTTGLLAFIIVGTLGAGIYIKISEKINNLLDTRLVILETDTKRQKKVNSIIFKNIAELKKGYKNLPDSLGKVRAEFKSIVLKNEIIEKKQKQKINSLISTLDKNIEEVGVWQ